MYIQNKISSTAYCKTMKDKKYFITSDFNTIVLCRLVGQDALIYEDPEDPNEIFIELDRVAMFRDDPGRVYFRYAYDGDDGDFTQRINKIREGSSCQCQPLDVFHAERDVRTMIEDIKLNKESYYDKGWEK